LCIVAGGVDLFLIGSEFRGLETIRGPGWTITGTTDGGGKAIWDYPFGAGMITLSDDVRSVFDTAGLTKDLTGLHNLISYAADWSDWMGWQHPRANPALPVADGQWPHLDQLWAHSNIDLVCFDNYMPLSDWTTGDGSLLPSGQSNNLDVANWSAPAAVDSAFDHVRVTQSVVSAADYGAVSLPVSSSGSVVGIPRGGWPIANALQKYCSGWAGGRLLVDDVWTTGATMENEKKDHTDIGVVLFARGPCPEWVHPVFQPWGAER
jgi:hypothetical protein